MKISEKALANGWGWVLGVSGGECRVYPQATARAADDPTEVLAQAAQLLGVEDAAFVPARIRKLQEEKRLAVASAGLAWQAVHTALRVHPEADKH
ncbi:hypothetical protein Q3V23_23440 [Streptomyces sp. VNUA116]|uniref:hypothetical protein n=1 Tax=Streptomyces sp. VNUA116 TaxID=3062449 RepID=UPI002674C7D5|nr:hypothetical protein [Streptomyces sp. VNUA116]WKU46775.1 hypothetical protein Q3V23_23440 [Streptomyces sp. VNUA116]